MAETNTVVTAIFAVFTQIANWFSTAIPTVISMFYVDGALTFLGGLAIIGVGISIVFLLVSVISNFLSLRA